MQLTLYDEVHDKVFTSLPRQVATYSSARQPVSGYAAPTATGTGDDGAYVDPNTAGTACSAGTVLGSTTYGDALGRTIATDDPLGTGAGAWKM